MEQYAEAVASALAGNQEGYDFLYQSTYQKKFFIAKKYMGNDMDAQDVLQDAYVQAFTKLNTLQDYQKFPNWFGMIVANTAKNALQKKKMLFFSDLEGVNEEGEAMELNIMDTDASRQPEIAYTEKETQEMVHEMLDTLPDDQRMCILMFHFEGASIREIAEAMECSENTVKSRLNYGRKAIKKKSEELQKKGYKLYSMAPLPLLLFLLRKEEEAFLQNAGFVIPSAASVMNQGVKIAKQASKGFLKTVAGKVTMTVAGLAAIGSIGTGIFLGANALQEKRTAPTPAPEQQVQATATETPTATPEPTQTPVPIADRWRDAYRKILSKKLKVKGYTENGKTGYVSDYSYFLSCSYNRRFSCCPTICICLLNNSQLIFFSTYWLSVKSACTCLLTQCRTYTACKLREITGLVKSVVCSLPISLIYQVIPLWYKIVKWTSACHSLDSHT